MTIKVIHGDSRDVLKTIPDNSVDSCCCDPPYALVSIAKRFGKDGSAPAKFGKDGLYQRASSGFMGQTWDTGEVAHDPAFWAEVYRVLKPGAHLVAFSGSRSHHRQTCAIEDAGFEIRDSIIDLIASDEGMAQFLNSLNDEQRGALFRAMEESRFGGMLAWLYGTGFPKSHDVSKGIEDIQFNEWLDEDPIHRRATFNIEIEQCGEDREAVNRVKLDWRDKAGLTTEPATELSKQWEGWGTALKPSLEPICLARKPLSEKSVAQNVLTHSTGALNIDATRIETDELQSGHHTRDEDNILESGLEGSFYYDGSKGRWPANTVHDESPEVISGFPDAGGGSDRAFGIGGDGILHGGGRGALVGTYADQRSAARFFFSAKADKFDRWGSKHPTVKRIDLMRWLVRMVTPPGGTVLDPFAGSGTTGIAALAEKFNAILIEREATYYQDIMERLAWYEGNARHSVVARNRNKKEKKGTLL